MSRRGRRLSQEQSEQVFQILTEEVASIPQCWLEPLGVLRAAARAKYGSNDLEKNIGNVTYEDNIKSIRRHLAKAVDLQEVYDVEDGFMHFAAVAYRSMLACQQILEAKKISKSGESK